MSQQWREQETSNMPDPLSGYRDKPIISQGGPNAQFVGRVIVELWENGSANDDSYKIAFSAQPMDNGDPSKLIERVATALKTRVQRDRPFSSN